MGPGVKKLGVDNTTWTSHADTRPTILALAGLHDDYTSEGRVLYEDMTVGAQPGSVSSDSDTVIRLAQAYTQINAPVGQFGLDTLKISTTALASTSAGDGTYASLEARLMGFGEQRDSIAGQMSDLLNGAEFGGESINDARANELIHRAQNLLERVHNLAA